FRILIEGDKVAFNPDNSVIKMGMLYGVFKRNGKVKIHNRIYEQRIYNYMASNIEVGLRKASSYNFENQFLLPDNKLDVEKILLKFQEFMKMEYSEQDQPFLEREWRLIFLAFIRPIVNGSGYTFKEPQISQEKRLDVVITFFQHQYLVELKRWEGLKYHKEGVVQLTDYLDRQKLKAGFLVIFEYRTKKTWRKQRVLENGKDIFAVWI
ncbi:MAG: GxxExxY protein, partial [Chitinophagales bacterium]